MSSRHALRVTKRSACLPRRSLSSVATPPRFPVASDHPSAIPTPPKLHELAGLLPYERKRVLSLKPLTPISNTQAQLVGYTPMNVVYDPQLLVKLHVAAARSFPEPAEDGKWDALRDLLRFIAADNPATGSYRPLHGARGVELCLYRQLLLPTNAIMHSVIPAEHAPIYWHEPRTPTRPRSRMAFACSAPRGPTQAAVMTPASVPERDLAALYAGLAEGTLYTVNDGSTRREGAEGAPRRAQGAACALLDQVKVAFAVDAPFLRFALVTNGHELVLAHRPPCSRTISVGPAVRAGHPVEPRLLPASPGGLVLALTLAVWAPPGAWSVTSEAAQADASC